MSPAVLSGGVLVRHAIRHFLQIGDPLSKVVTIRRLTMIDRRKHQKKGFFPSQTRDVAFTQRGILHTTPATRVVATTNKHVHPFVVSPLCLSKALEATLKKSSGKHQPIQKNTRKSHQAIKNQKSHIRHLLQPKSAHFFSQSNSLQKSTTTTKIVLDSRKPYYINNNNNRESQPITCDHHFIF